MLYNFFRRFLPVLLLGIVIYTVLFLAYIGFFQISSAMIAREAHGIRERSADDIDYANNVKLWVYQRIHIPPKFKGITEIQPPELSYFTQQGDCSERSLLMTRMLKDEGVEARPVYGYVGATGHMSVEYVYNGTVNNVEKDVFPDFVKEGDGVKSDSEYVYDVYWFLPWKESSERYQLPKYMRGI